MRLPSLCVQDRLDSGSSLKAASRGERAPVEDLRLADQMVCLSLVGEVVEYNYWYFQYWATGE